MRALVLAAAACGGTAKQRPIPVRPRIAVPALPPSYALDIVVPAQTKLDARLRLDEGGRPYLVGRNVFLPLPRLASGEPAKPFKIAKASAIGDATWSDDGVLLLVVGSELGVIREQGFVKVATLPAPDMRVVAATKGQVWLYAPDAPDGRLYLYDKSGTVTVPFEAGAPIRAVSGTPNRVYVAIGKSLLRITDRVELVFASPDPIIAIAATAKGAYFSTTGGTYFRTEPGVVSRIAKDGAIAIATHGEEVFLQLESVGIVRGTPTSAFDGTQVEVVSEPPPPPPVRRVVRMSARRKFAIVMGVGGLAAIGTGLWFGRTADRDYDDALASGHCDERVICDDIGFAQIEDAHADARIATIVTISGAALLTTATILWLTGRSSASATTTAIVPTAHDHIGFALWRRF
jgi:hypothetical protein